MSDDNLYGVHLFHGTKLIANLTTAASEPEQSYEVGGVIYDVVSHRGLQLQSSGGEGWDVQVEPRT